MPDRSDAPMADARPEFYSDPMKFVDSWRRLSVGEAPLDIDAFEDGPPHDEARVELIMPGDFVRIGKHRAGANWSGPMDYYIGKVAKVSDDITVGCRANYGERRAYSHVTPLGARHAVDWWFHLDSMLMLSAVRAEREARLRALAPVHEFEEGDYDDNIRDRLILPGDVVLLGAHRNEALETVTQDDVATTGAGWTPPMRYFVGCAATVLSTHELEDVDTGDRWVCANVELLGNGLALPFAWRLANMRMRKSEKEQRMLEEGIEA